MTTWNPGDWLDERFHLQALIGRGSFGEVWRALDARSNTVVAVKILFDRFLTDPKVLGRFRQETDILLGLDHPNIATAVARSPDDEDDQAYLAMELVVGKSLDQQFKPHSKLQSRLSGPGVMWVVRRIANALDHAHARHVIHRDLKPKNIMLGKSDGEPFLKVLDFGLAKVLVGGQLDPTTAGKLLGSVLYVAPEQVRSQPVDARSDVFALATIAFEMFTFRRTWALTEDGHHLPWHEAVGRGPTNGHVAVLKRILAGPRPRISRYRDDLPAALEAVVQQGLSINADDRQATAGQFADRLQEALNT